MAVADQDCRVVLLEAEPGAGKTALIASLARTHPNWLRFFLRRDSRTPWRSWDARSFLLTTGHQLAAQRPKLFRSRQLKVTVKQIVDRVRSGGRVVGISVGDLSVSPFYRTALRVEQRVSVLDHAAERNDEDSTSTYLRLDALPTSLSELYAFLLNQIRAGVRDLTVDRPGAGMYAAPVREAAWPALYQPILGLLTVAYSRVPGCPGSMPGTTDPDTSLFDSWSVVRVHMTRQRGMPLSASTLTPAKACRVSREIEVFVG